MVDPDGVLFYHPFLVERLHLQVLESLVILEVQLAHFGADWDLFLLEKVDQIGHQWAHFFLFVQHRHHKCDELARILRNWLRILVNYRVEKLCDCAFVEWWL